MLFKNMAEIQQYLPVSNAVEFDRLKPHIHQIENEFIIPLMSKDLYNELCYHYLNPDPNETLRLDAIHAAQNAIIHLVYWRGFDVLNAYISDSGFKRSESDKVKSLFKYQEDNLRDYFKNVGFDALDVLLEKLEIIATICSPSRLSEDWYKAFHDDFVNNAKAFDSLYFINGSRIIFLRLKKYMQQVKDLQLSKVLGPANYAFILSEIAKTDTIAIAAKVKEILPFINKPLAFLSVALLMEDSGCDITDKGLVYDGKISVNGGDAAKTPSESVRVMNLIKRNRGIGEAYLCELKNYLLDHASDWGNYTAPQHGILNRDNSGKKTFWI
ncbi:MAG: DUF6712 family protein [Bacteroidales bacterium]